MPGGRVMPVMEITPSQKVRLKELKRKWKCYALYEVLEKLLKEVE